MPQVRAIRIGSKANRECRSLFGAVVGRRGARTAPKSERQQSDSFSRAFFHCKFREHNPIAGLEVDAGGAQRNNAAVASDEPPPPRGRNSLTNYKETNVSNPVSLTDRVMGSIIGSAVGDALGAPCECLHYSHILKVYGDFKGFKDLIAVGAGWPWNPPGGITDDTVLADLLMDCIVANDGILDAHLFAQQWEFFETPVPNPGGDPVVRLNYMHYIEKIPYLRNKLREINKRELGHGEANATNAIMYIGPVGLLCAGDPNKAAVMAADVTAVNQHGNPRDAAAGYAAGLAACFAPGATVDSVIETSLAFTRDYLLQRAITAMLDLARKCKDCTEFVRRYYEDIIGPIIPFQDIESLDRNHWHFKDQPMCVSWNSAEILGPSLATLLITRGEDAPEMMLACAKIGRDADTICRCAGGLIGAWRGRSCIPADWQELVLARNRWLRLEEKGQALAEIVRRRAGALGRQLLDMSGGN